MINIDWQHQCFFVKMNGYSRQTTSNWKFIGRSVNMSCSIVVLVNCAAIVSKLN